MSCMVYYIVQYYCTIQVNHCRVIRICLRCALSYRYLIYFPVRFQMKTKY